MSNFIEDVITRELRHALFCDVWTKTKPNNSLNYLSCLAVTQFTETVASC